MRLDCGRDKRHGFNGPQENYSRNRYYQPDDRQYYNRQRSNGRQLSNGQRFNDRQRSYNQRSDDQQQSYASITRAGPRTDGDTTKSQAISHNFFNPGFLLKTKMRRTDITV
ncbi:hypothetical protein KUCAC02_009638 [Chaenocephalus aceratus]|nr:hypothetical protein KUCAC02_009638 [Chaenocephalus aceratus]